MHQILSRFAALVPEFGRRSLSLNDLRDQCETHGIDIFEIPMRRIHGCSWTDEYGPAIYLNRLISAQLRTIAGWHEYFHLSFHPTDKRVLMSLGKLTNRAKWERESQTAGMIALMPLPDIAECSIEAIASRFGVPKKVAVDRLIVYERYRI